MAENTVPKLKKRKKNFSAEEKEVLVREVEDHRDILFALSKDSKTNQMKKQCWENICSKTNSLGFEKRTPTEIEKKWRDISFQSKWNLERSGAASAPVPINSSDISQNVNSIPDRPYVAVEDVCDTDDGVYSIKKEKVLQLTRHLTSMTSTFQQSSGPPSGEHSATQALADFPDHEKQPQRTKTNNAGLKRKRTAEDVYDLQCQVLEQKLVKTKLDIEKDKLKIDLLKEFRERVRSEGTDPSLAAFLNNVVNIL